MSIREAMVELSARRGWLVFPIRPRTKVPYKSARNHNGRRWGATADPEEIERDFTRWRRAAGAVALGEGIIVVDIDTGDGHQHDGVAAAALLARRGMELPGATLQATTPSGGRHVFLRSPPGKVVRPRPLSALPGWEEYTGIDIKGDGSYVLVSPSERSVEDGGGRYEWVNPEAEILDAPEWLLAVVCEDLTEVESRRQAQWDNREPVDEADVAAAVARIPNEDLDWDAWNRVGMAIWRATDGSDLGLELFLDWSAKSEKHDDAYARRKWAIFATTPPTHIGVGTVLWLADQAQPGWRGVERALRAMEATDPDAVDEATPQSITSDIDDATQGGESGANRRETNRSSREGGGSSDTRPPSSSGDQRIPPGGTPDASERPVDLSDFRAYMPTHQFVYEPTGDLWPAASVNSKFGKVPVVNSRGEVQVDEDGKEKLLAAAQWLVVHRPVEQLVWAPQMPRIIRGRYLVDGGWVEKTGAACYNLYRPCDLHELGDHTRAEPWVAHVRRLFSEEDAERFLDYAAHAVQHPGVKVNHCQLLSGQQGIGKDTALEPIRRAVGPWNVREISPVDVLSPWSDYQQTVVLIIQEMRDLGDQNRYQFYERSKTLTAAPPDVVRVNQKYAPQRMVLNVCHVYETTNSREGVYLTADDRRHHVLHSDLTKEDYESGYWTEIYSFFADEDRGGGGGFAHCAAWLMRRDLSAFDAKAPPPRTQAFDEIVNQSMTQERPEVETALHHAGSPPALTVGSFVAAMSGRGDLSSLYEWFTDRANRRAHARVLAEAGYVPVRYRGAASGLWAMSTGERAVIYARMDLGAQGRYQAAEALARGTRDAPEPPPPDPRGPTVREMPTRGRRRPLS